MREDRHTSLVWQFLLRFRNPLVLILVAASIGIGFVADRTRSIFAAASFHVLGNIMGTTTDFTTLIPSQHARWMIVLICVVAWLIMLRLWGMHDKRAAAALDRA